MEAIREIHTVKQGKVHVHLPMQFWGQQVEVIVLPVSHQEQPSSPKKSLRGCLHQYANPALIAHEHEAWQEVVSEKYGSH
jgi:thiamine pyrophosphate-dependent acetolactate synthase large subunit-like protein